MKNFQETIQKYYREHRRSFAWRNTRDPWRILVSEVMLQQTQTERVKKIYPLFLKKFPNPRTLAKASLPAVLKAWQGMGYNRRAKFLRAIAQKMVKEHNSKVPANEESLVALPGIGRNTAGAIMAFAFNKPVVFIETNIRRAYIYHFFPGSEKVEDEKLLPLIEKTLKRDHPREWYYALMDYGAALGRDKKIENPNRRSKRYKKQSTFEGSDRKIRGEMIRTLLRNKSMSTREMFILLHAPKQQYNRVMTSLTKEGIIVISDKRIRLAK